MIQTANNTFSVAVNYPRFSISRDDAGWRPSLDEVRPSLEGSGEEISEQTKEVREGHSSWEPDTPKVMVVCLGMLLLCR